MKLITKCATVLVKILSNILYIQLTICSVLPDAIEALGIPSTTSPSTVFVKDFHKL